ncbi:MAG: hypothetical protein QOG54_2443 [Actinomycetota bacterium]|nr:hypothetical protein [Actinomycetota bacterium]
MKRFLALLFVLGLVMTACGSDDPGDGGDTSAESCDDPSPAAELADVPEGFPQPDGTTYTGGDQAGPSFIAQGYFDGNLQTAFDDYHAAFEDAGYDITKDEIEEHDAEVFFAGEGTTGQVNLYADLDCSTNTKLRVTIRPD